MSHPARPAKTTQYPFYHSTDCDILAGQDQRKAYTGFDAERVKEHPARFRDLYRGLMQQGYRRYPVTRPGEDVVFTREECLSCHFCKAARISLRDFILQKSLKRVFAKNSDLHPRLVSPENLDIYEHAQLFENYLRHKEMLEGSATQKTFDPLAMQILLYSPVPTWTLEMRDRDKQLQGAIVAESVSPDIYAKLHYYDPVSLQNSPGLFLIANLARNAQKAGYTHMYLGNWSPSGRLSYKGRFRGLEILDHGHWRPVANTPGQ